MTFELPYPEIELPHGEEPLVLVAPSTSQDPENRLVRAALKALAEEPVRVVATINREASGEPPEVPPNAILVDWLSYSQVMPMASLVVCHGGHGTVARALGEGVPVLTSPVAGDMNETAARIAWAGSRPLGPLAASAGQDPCAGRPGSFLTIRATRCGPRRSPRGGGSRRSGAGGRVGGGAGAAQEC